MKLLPEVVTIWTLNLMKTGLIKNRTFLVSRGFLLFHQKHEKLTAKQSFNLNHVKLSCWHTDSGLMAKIYVREIFWRTCDSNLGRLT